MNAIMERWIQTCRRELLDRTLIWNQTHLLRALRQYERHYNEHRPHRGINARPLKPLPEPITNPHKITYLVSADETDSVASCTNTNVLHDLERVPAFVEVEVAVLHLRPSEW
jgi:hypothetical protein